MLTRLARCWRRFVAERRGIAAVEFALVAPVLILFLLGTAEIAIYALLQLKVQHAADSMADLTAREPELTAAKLNDLFDAVAHIVAPANAPADRVVIVTCTGSRGSAVPHVLWRRSGAGTLSATSEIGTVNGRAHLPEDLVVRDGETVIVAEMYYRYRSSFLGLIPDNTIRRVAYYRSRLTTPDTL